MFRTLQQNDPRYCCAIVSPKCTFVFVISPKEWIIFMGWDHDTYSGSTYFRKRNIPSLGENNVPDQVNAKFIDVCQIYKFWYVICVHWERQRDRQGETREYTCPLSLDTWPSAPSNMVPQRYICHLRTTKLQFAYPANKTTGLTSLPLHGLRGLMRRK